MLQTCQWYFQLRWISQNLFESLTLCVVTSFSTFLGVVMVKHMISVSFHDCYEQLLMILLLRHYCIYFCSFFHAYCVTLQNLQFLWWQKAATIAAADSADVLFWPPQCLILSLLLLLIFHLTMITWILLLLSLCIASDSILKMNISFATFVVVILLKLAFTQSCSKYSWHICFDK